MKVKILAHKGHIVTIPSDVMENIGEDWSPTGDTRMGSTVRATPENLGISQEALDLMVKAKPNRDAVGDLMWSHGTFSWWGAMFRTMDIERAERARDFRIAEGQYTLIDNVLTDAERRAVEHSIRLKTTIWKWPYGLNTKHEGPKFGNYYASYHPGQVYIASAYSHEDPKVVEERVARAEMLCAKLVAKGVHAFSPVVYGTALMKHGPMHEDTSWNTWQHFCNAYLDNSTAVYVLKDDAWDKSLGVSGEKMRAAINGMETFLIDPETLELEPLKSKMPIHMMSEDDVREICRLLGKKYSHFDRSEKGDRVFHAKDARIIVYPGMTASNLIITGSGEVQDPLDFGSIDMLKLIREQIEKINEKETLDDKDVQDVKEFEARLEQYKKTLLPEEGLEKAKEIISKYHYEQK